VNRRILLVRHEAPSDWRWKSSQRSGAHRTPDRVLGS